MTPKIRIVVVDDNRDIHDIVRLLLKDKQDIELVGQAYDGEAALKLCQIAKPDLVLMDVILPTISGAETTRTILSLLPATKVLALSSFHEYEYIQTMFESGASGYLVKAALSQDLVTTIHDTMQGNAVLSPQAARALFAPTRQPSDVPDYALTEREREVLKLMADGLTYSGIAHALSISAPTVRFHINNILEKMSVTTRSEALVLAAKYSLV